MLINAFYNLRTVPSYQKRTAIRAALGAKQDIKTCLRVPVPAWVPLCGSAKGGKKFFVILRVVFLGRFAKRSEKHLRDNVFSPPRKPSCIATWIPLTWTFFQIDIQSRCIGKFGFFTNWRILPVPFPKDVNAFSWRIQCCAEVWHPYPFMAVCNLTVLSKLPVIRTTVRSEIYLFLFL